MIYWLCQPNSRSRSAIILTASVFLVFVMFGSYAIWQLTSVFFLVAYMTYQLLSHHGQLPLALSVRDEDWRCHYREKVMNYQLRKGFALGPLALIDLFDSESQESMRLVILKWDITPSSQAGASWQQLGTMLKYAQGPLKRPFSESNNAWFYKNGL